MDHRRQRMVIEAKKIIDNINAMSLEKLDDQQLRLLIMMRAIARGIVDNRVEKVTEEDIQKEMRSSINRMVGSCKNVGNILNKIPAQGLNQEQKNSVSRMKEIVSNVVVKRAKLEIFRRRKSAESEIVQVNEVDSPANGGDVVKDIGVEEIQTGFFENGKSSFSEYGDDSPANGVDVETVEAEVGVKEIDVKEFELKLFEYLTTIGAASYLRANFEEWMISKIDFDTLGIPHLPSWSVRLPSDANGPRVIQVPRLPPGSVVEGLPLSSYLPEPHKPVLVYLLELIAALKHMISARETHNDTENR